MEQNFSAQEHIPAEPYTGFSESYQQRPLARLLDDEHTRVLEELIPYCDHPVKRLLALEIKCREINKILHGFDQPVLKACGLDTDQRDMETLLRSIRGTVSSSMASQIDSLLQMLQFMKMYQRFSEITRDHPEIIQMMGTDRSGSGGNGQNAFADPSIYMLLNTMLGNGEGGNNQDQMKNVLELAMKGSSENMDMANLLTSLLNRQS